MTFNSIEDFIDQYESFVREWFQFKNNANLTHVEEEDFWSELLVKIVQEDLLNKYNPDHYSKASFKTWLKRVLNNLYIDMSRKIAKGNWVPIDTTDDDEHLQILEERFNVDKNIEVDLDKDMIAKYVEDIPKVRDRILVKLKTYIDGSTVLDDEEYEYLENVSELSDVKGFISENIYNRKAGIKDKDICKLLDMKKGTINTTYQRIVRKYVTGPYTIYRAKYGKN